MNLSKTIFNDVNSKIVGDILVTDVEVSIPDVSFTMYKQDLDNGISHAITRYTPTFYYYTNDTIIGRSIAKYGEYTQLEIELLKNFLTRNSVVYDVGANIGYHALAFAKLCKYVYAFEPNKKHLELLRKNLRYGNVEIFDVAVSDRPGTLKIQDFDINTPGNYGELYCNKNGYDVTSIRLDDLDLEKPDLIKIDVEGFELNVLRGCSETIREHNPVIFYEAHGTELREIFDFLTDFEYRLYWYPCPNFNPQNYRETQHNIFGNGGVLNILALPKHIAKVSNLLDIQHRDETIKDSYERYNNKK